MRLLAIECATPTHSVALVQGERVLAEESYVAEGTRGGRLLPALDAVLRRAGVPADALEAIAVSIGPGSFTGVRVGVATAKGLALGTEAALVGVSTLRALAEGYCISEGVVCGLLDAGQGELYASLFSRSNGNLQRLREDAVLRPESLVEWLGKWKGMPYLIGNGAARYRGRLEELFSGGVQITEAGLVAVPAAAVVARIGLRQLRRRSTGERPDLVPVYLRRPEAEANWEKGRLRSPLAKVT
jgi:tRNA threonylcarbamoyladenosine biosynthesis protein TsaB